MILFLIIVVLPAIIIIILSSNKKKVKETRTVIHQYVDKETGELKEREEKQIVETERGVTTGEALLKICLVAVIGIIILFLLMLGCLSMG